MKKEHVFLFYLVLIVGGGLLAYNKSKNNEIVDGLKGSTLGIIISLILYYMFKKSIY